MAMRMIFSLVRGEMVPRFTNLVLGSVIELQPCHIPVFSAILLQSEEGELPVHAVAQSDLEDGDVAHTGAGHVVIPQVQL